MNSIPYDEEPVSGFNTRRTRKIHPHNLRDRIIGRKVFEELADGIL